MENKIKSNLFVLGLSFDVSLDDDDGANGIPANLVDPYVAISDEIMLKKDNESVSVIAMSFFFVQLTHKDNRRTTINKHPTWSNLQAE